MASLTSIFGLTAGGVVPAAEASLQAAVLLGAAWLACAALRRQPAALRHMIWVLALAAAVATPFLPNVLPNLALPASWTPAMGPAAGDEAPDPLAPRRELPHPSGFDHPNPSMLPPPSENEYVMALVAPVPLPPDGPDSTEDGTRVSIASMLIAVWAIGFLVFGTRLLTGHIRLRWLAREARELHDLGDLPRRVNLGRAVCFLRSKGEVMPMTWGWTRPVVLLPASFQQWTPERREMTVLHELAHVKRADWLSQTLAQMVRAVYWFHPLVWLALRRIQLEADRSCDDMVLRAGSKASGYAEHLVWAVRQYRAAGLRPWVAIAMAQSSSLDERVRYVLDRDVDRAGVGVRKSLLAGLGIAALVLVISSGAVAGQTDASQTAPEPGIELAVASENTFLAAAEEKPVEQMGPQPLLLAQAEPQPEPTPPREAEPALVQADPAPEARQREAQARQREAQARQREAQARQREAQARRREAQASQRAMAAGQRAAQLAARQARPQLSPESLQTAAAALRKALGSSDSKVRAQAAEALGRLGVSDEANLEALSASLSDEEPRVQRSAAESLGRLVRLNKEMPADQAVRWLTPALSAPDARVRREAVEALGWLGGAAAIEAVTKAVDDPDPRVQREAIGSLGRLLRSSDADLAKSSLPVLQRALKHEDPNVRKQVVETLGALRSIADDVVPLLAQGADDPEPNVQRAAVEALGAISSGAEFRYRGHGGFGVAEWDWQEMEEAIGNQARDVEAQVKYVEKQVEALEAQGAVAPRVGVSPSPPAAPEAPSPSPSPSRD